MRPIAALALLALACGGIPDPEALAPDIPVVVEPSPPGEPPIEPTPEIPAQRYTRELAGTWSHNSSTLLLNGDGTFSIRGVDPCGQREYGGRWQVTRTEGCCVNAMMGSKITQELVITAFKEPNTGAITQSIGLDCHADMGMHEPKTYWTRDAAQ